ncbi:MAG: hydroxypyruvate isomerase [Ramlibacter sp.]
MPRFAANLSMLFTELPFMDRFAAARDAGFYAVEYLFPYPYDQHALAAQLKRHSLRQVLHNLPAGNWDAGERGIACIPGREEEFRAGVAQAIAYATALHCPQVNCLAGKLPEGVTPGQAHDTLVANLRYAAAALKDAGIRLLLEPVNPFDIPGFYVTRTDQALAIMDAAGSDNLYLQYDIYHAQRTEGELAATIERHLPRIAHIQLADNPGRHEPGTGEINWPWLLARIDALGWRGHIGCEYKPRTSTTDGLGWLNAFTTHKETA